MEITLPKQSAEFSTRDQTQYLVLAGAASAVLAVARWLQPATQGVGTHQQLGLPPCYFLQLTGIPCPACGLTTSFAHMVRLQVYDAFSTQPFGALACMVTAAIIPLCIFLIYRRVAWLQFYQSRSLKIATYVGGALMLAGWIYKIFITRQA